MDRNWGGVAMAVLFAGQAAFAQQPDSKAEADAAKPARPRRSVARELGFGPDEKLLIIHSDDAGMCHSVNVATIKAMTKGVVNSASLMVPCPWFTEMAEYCREHPEMDFGLHMTLTSEWKHYRWRSVTPISKVPGLLDKDWFMWRDVEDVVLHAKPEEVERELRAQVKRAIAFGMKPTHLDTHMGTVFARADFFQAYRKVANEFGLPYLLPRLRPERLAEMGPMMQVVAALLEKEMSESKEFTLDDLISIKNVPVDKQKQFYLDAIRGLRPGITQIIIHCGTGNAELRAVTNAHRTRDMDTKSFMSHEIKRAIAEAGVRLITWREIGERQRKHLGLHGDVPASATQR